jgi:hypothetical protein
VNTKLAEYNHHIIPNGPRSVIPSCWYESDYCNGVLFVIIAAYPDTFNIVRQQDSEGNIVYTKLHAAKAFKKGEKICDISNIEHGREKVLIIF